MKLIIQRVSKAKVTKVDTNEVAGEIGKGLFVLLGIKKGDTAKQADELADKLSKIRLMADQNQKMNLSVLDTKSEVLVVSQFTLYANTKDGNRPSFVEAEEPVKAKELYGYFIEKLKSEIINIQNGSFGDYMRIEVELDGPVTITLTN